MNQDRASPRLMGRHHPPVESQDGRGIVWYSMIWPGCEVELLHLKWTIISLQLAPIREKDYIKTLPFCLVYSYMIETRRHSE